MGNRIDDSIQALAQAIVILRPIDDDMMCTSLQDEKDLHKPGDAHPLVLRILASDSDGTKNDIEVQRTSLRDALKKPRYHSSVLDTAALRANDDFNALPRTCVIFITERDCIEESQLLHRYGMCDVKIGKPLDTEQQIIYLNTAFDGEVRKGNENLAALAHDFKCADPEDMILEPVADRMRFLKDTKEGMTQMSSVVQLYAQQAVNKERKRNEERDLKHAQNLYATGKHTVSEIADLLELDVDEVRKACGLQPVV